MQATIVIYLKTNWQSGTTVPALKRQKQEDLYEFRASMVVLKES